MNDSAMPGPSVDGHTGTYASAGAGMSRRPPRTSAHQPDDAGHRLRPARDEMRRAFWGRVARAAAVAAVFAAGLSHGAFGQEPAAAAAAGERERVLAERIERLERRLAELEASLKTTAPAAVPRPAEQEAKTASVAPGAQRDTAAAGGDDAAPTFLRGTTVNFAFDGYYGWNFNRPFDRVNALRAYDTSANSFTVAQAGIVVEHLPDPDKGRRFGFRLDLQFGQATQTLQGSSANELRPEIYRPLWQAYGTYVAPVGRGLTLDFGKFAGSLGFETNYAKDNFNYSRSYFFNFLPYYHVGLRASLPVTDKLTASYWLVNGVQQSEDFNNSKSQAVLLTFKPNARVTLQGNYYAGREQRDQARTNTVTPPASADIAGGRLTPKGRLHVLDAYATVAVDDKTTFAIEADYVVARVDRRDAPARVTGGAAYLRRQFTPKFAAAVRGEYLSDRRGLFSGAGQALKEATLTAEYKFAEGFMMRAEYRRDWSNRRFFAVDDPNAAPRKRQDTATLGLVWWFGRKQGAW